MSYIEISGYNFSENMCIVGVESNEPLIALDMWYTVTEVYVEYFNGIPVEQKVVLADNVVMIQPLDTYNIVFSYVPGLKYIVEVGVFEDVYNGTGERVTEDRVEFISPTTPPVEEVPEVPSEEVYDYVNVKVIDSAGRPIDGVVVELFRCDVPWPVSCPYMPYGLLGLEPGYRLISTKTTDTTGIVSFTDVNKDYDYAIAIKYKGSVKYQFRLTEPNQFNKTYTITVEEGILEWFHGISNIEKAIVISAAAITGAVIISSIMKKDEKVVVVRE